MASPKRENRTWLTREQLNNFVLQATRLGRRAWVRLLAFAWWSSKQLPVVSTHLSDLFAWCRTRAEAVAPKLSAALPLARGGNRLSSWAGNDAKPSQMLIIVGALLLVCGGLLLGSGLILRAGTPASSGSSEPIAWLFETPEAPLTHRIVFDLSGPPADIRINGLSIRGENTLDEPLTEVEAVIKPDVSPPDLKLALNTGRPVPQVVDPGVVEIEVTASVPPATAVIPARTPFDLVYAFPAGASGKSGLTVEEFFETYGGLTLNVRYGLEGKRRTFIQYLSPEMLKAQLAEVETAGS